jgi:hypothetical protein
MIFDCRMFETRTKLAYIYNVTYRISFSVLKPLV